ANHLEKSGFDQGIGEERPPRARVANPQALLPDAEALSRYGLVTAHDDYGARSHVLLFTNHRRNTLLLEVVKSLIRVLQQIRPLRRLAGRHRGGKIDNPSRINGEAAHHFERGDGILFAD